MVAVTTRSLTVRQRVELTSFAIAGLSAVLAWYGWTALATFGPLKAIRAGQLHYCEPIVLGFVALVFFAERIWLCTAVPVTCRSGHDADLGYLVLYALVVLPIVTLLGSGLATLLERHASWLVIPHISASADPGAFVVLDLVAIDATDWLIHFVNHRFNPLWRFHAVHHSQEEVSVLTTFRAHPLVHLSFVLTVVPGFRARQPTRPPR